MIKTCLCVGALALACQFETFAEPRIVSAGGAITETIFALGAGKTLVAVDSAGALQPEAKGLPVIGYSRDLSAEGVLSMNPSLILLNHDAGPPAVVDQLKESGIPLRQFSSVDSAESAIRRIRDIGEAVDRQREAEALVAGIERSLAKIEKRVRSEDARPRVLFIYTRGGGTMNVSGRKTAADAMIALAGGANAVSGYDGYKPLTSEGVVNAAPDVILIPSRGLEQSGGIDELLRQPGLALTPAGRARKVIAMDDVLLLSFGPRFAEAALQLNEQLFPPAKR